MTMGTASTMTSGAEVLGFILPGFSSIPAPDSRHAQMATLSGRRIVEMVWEDLKPSDILSDESFDNAVTTVLALSGSSNSVVHLIAMARRAGLALDLERFDAIARRTPVLANVRPAGKYLMEDFFYAGGLRAMLAELGDLLDGGTRNVNGRTLGENLAGAKTFAPDVIRSRPTPSLRCSRTPAARSCSPTTTTWPRASTIRRSTWTRRPCSFSRTPVRSARPACPSGASSPSPRSCSSRECATWCASPTHG